VQIDVVSRRSVGAYVHKRIAEQALAGLKDEQATYFADIIHEVAEDPRTQDFPNMMFMVLRNTIAMLPTYLPRRELIERLFAFVQINKAKLSRTMFSKEFVTNEKILREVTDLFVDEVVSVSLQRYEKGEIDSGEVRVHKVSWPYNNVDFPFEDDDEIDEDEF